MRPAKKQSSRSRRRISARRAMACKLKAGPSMWCSTLPLERNRRSRPKSLIARAHSIPRPSRLRNQTALIKRPKSPLISLPRNRNSSGALATVMLSVVIGETNGLLAVGDDRGTSAGKVRPQGRPLYLRSWLRLWRQSETNDIARIDRSLPCSTILYRRLPERTVG